MSDSLFERIDKSIALIKALEYLDVTFSGAKLGWQKVHCPHGDAHPRGDRNPSCSVNLTIGRVKCHSCGLRGDWAGIMYDIQGIKVDEAAQLLGLDKMKGVTNETWTGDTESYLF